MPRQIQIRVCMMAVTVAALAMTACSQAAEPELTVVSTSATIAATTVRSSTTTVLASTTTLIAEPTTTSSTLAPLPPLPALLAAQVDELVAITEELRGLQFIEPPMIEVLTPEEVTERRREILEEDLDRDELAYEEAFYKLVGIFGPDDDLYDFYTSFYSAGTLAYYDLEDQRLIVPLAGDTLNEYEKWILVHELTHALMDQHYGEVADRFENSDEDGDFDEIGSILSLLEGEAVLIQTLYLHGLDSTRRAEVVEIAGQHSNPTFGSAPQFFRELIRFPYTAGSLLTSDLYRRGGTEAINQAFEQPPRSTEHVLHVESYLELEPIVSIEPLEISLDGYEVAEEGTWGERGWRVLLDHYLASAESVEAAEGWGGDRYAIAWNADTSDVLFVVVYAGDSFGDASELAGALGAFVEAGVDVGRGEVSGTAIEWSGDSYAYLARDGDEIVFIVASDPDAGRAVVASLRG